MRLRTFRARTLVEAMAQIRAELGPDALILSDQTHDGLVEITAAIEGAPVRAAAHQRAASSSAGGQSRAAGATPAHALVPPSSRGLAPVFDDLEPLTVGFDAAAASSVRRPPPAAMSRGALLAWHGLDPSLTAALSQGPLAQACERCFRFEPMVLAADEPPLLLGGIAGSGKTLTCARLATRLVLEGRKPLVITADGQRAGAIEQLSAFTRLLGLTMIVAETPVVLARALARRVGGQPVLVDAPGLDARDREDAQLLRQLLQAAGARLALVMPGGLDALEAQDIAAAYEAEGARLLVATRLDKTRRLGSLLRAASSAGLALSEAGLGSAVADGLVPFTPQLLANRLERTAPAVGGVPAHAPQPASPQPMQPVVVRHGALPLHIAAQRRGASTP